MRIPRLLTHLLLISSFCIIKTVPISWLSLVRVDGSTSLCNASIRFSYRKYGLVKRQTRLCRDAKWLGPAVIDAAHLTAQMCQKVFSNQRWNCSSVLKAPNLTPDLTRGTQEQAVVYAMASAALAYTMTRRCSRDYSRRNCGCGAIPREPAGPNNSYVWNSCPLNIKEPLAHANRFAMGPFRSRGKKRLSIQAMNKHNIKAGLKILRSMVHKKCKCYGVSASCQYRSCWMALPAHFDEVAIKLKEHFTSAIEVKAVGSGSGLALRAARRTRHLAQQSSVPRRRLVYLAMSPDYCSPDKRSGSVGTRGRQCSVSSGGSLGCDSMCCRRGYRHETATESYKCNCYMKQCCTVVCQDCTRQIDLYYCF